MNLTFRVINFLGERYFEKLMKSALFILKLEVHTEALIAEASKDRKLREQSEHYSKQLENELEGLKVSLDLCDS